jgi:hypothetical protein
MAGPDKRPLIAYLNVQEGMERKLLFILARAASDAEKIVLAGAQNRGIGAKIRVEQQNAIRANLLREQAALWRKIGSEVEARRLDAAAAAIEVDGFYTEKVLRAVTSAEQRTILREALQAQAKASVDVAVARLQGMSYVPLSDRVYSTQRLASGMIDRKVTSLLARGLSARDIAAEMRGFIRPDVPGGVSYAAMRLGRTELNNAFHATQVRDGVENPFIEYLRWMLSGSHPRPDVCNEYATVQEVRGQDAGVWDPGRIPAKPHPQCLCYTIPITPSRDKFVDKYLAGDYDSYVDDLMRQQGRSEEWIAASKK